MQLRRRIILLGGAAAIAAIGLQPASAIAGTLTCDSFIPGPPTWTFQFGCGDNIGCYYNGIATYDTFDCLTNTPGGMGCDSQRCFDTN